MSNWTATWTGKYPTLCHGEWELYRDGELVDTDIPFKNEPANTYGTSGRWAFDENHEVFFVKNKDADGLKSDEWIAANRGWLESIADKSEFGNIFEAFRISDWRRNSCGGCLDLFLKLF